MPVVSFADLAARVLASAPRCGATRLVCVDGPSGSGKTVLAGRLVRAFGGPPLVHMDDLHPGWDGLARAVPLLHEWIIGPLTAGRPARYRRYDWDRGDYAEEHDLRTPSLLLIEGVGAGARVIATHAVLLVWIEAPPTERLRRGMERDGEAYRPHWKRWAEQENAHFAAEGTRERADLQVDGAPDRPHAAERELVVGFPSPGPRRVDSHRRR